MADQPPRRGTSTEADAAVALPASQVIEAFQLLPLPPTQLYAPLGSDSQGRSGFASTIRVAEALGLATGVLLGTWWAGPVPAAAVGAAMLAVLLAPNRYRWQFNLSLLDELPSMVALLATITMATASTLLLTEYTIEARGALLAGTVVLFTTLLSRMIAYVLIRRLRCQGIGLARAVVVGSGETGKRLASRLMSDLTYGVRLLGFIDDDMSLPPYPAPVLGSVDTLKGLIRQYHIDLVLVAFGARSSEAIIGSLRELNRAHCEIYVVPRLFELHEHPWHGELIGGTPLVRLSRSAFRHPSWPLKRVLDVILAAFGLILTCPLLAVIALAVRKETGSDVIFKQERVGMDGKPFTLYKFCSFAPLAAEGETRWSIDGDPRLGPVGRFIRSTSLDELPQLVNVLKGDMSLVGPRPERPFFANQFDVTIPGYRYRHRVPVGLTGYAAVNGLRGDTSIAERALFDNLYADSWSLWLDVKIMLRTFTQLFRR